MAAETGQTAAVGTSVADAAGASATDVCLASQIPHKRAVSLSIRSDERDGEAAIAYRSYFIMFGFGPGHRRKPGRHDAAGFADRHDVRSGAGCHRRSSSSKHGPSRSREISLHDVAGRSINRSCSRGLQGPEYFLDPRL